MGLVGAHCHEATLFCCGREEPRNRGRNSLSELGRARDGRSLNLICYNSLQSPSRYSPWDISPRSAVGLFTLQSTGPEDVQHARGEGNLPPYVSSSEIEYHLISFSLPVGLAVGCRGTDMHDVAVTSSTGNGGECGHMSGETLPMCHPSPRPSVCI